MKFDIFVVDSVLCFDLIWKELLTLRQNSSRSLWKFHRIRDRIGTAFKIDNSSRSGRMLTHSLTLIGLIALRRVSQGVCSVKPDRTMLYISGLLREWLPVRLLSGHFVVGCHEHTGILRDIPQCRPLGRRKRTRGNLNDASSNNANKTSQLVMRIPFR